MKKFPPLHASHIRSDPHPAGCRRGDGGGHPDPEVLVGPKLRTTQKSSTYESGVPLIDASHKRISIQFFVIAMVFILFDVEIAFIYPWALVFRSAGWPLFLEMLVFLAILAVGYAYIWKKGAFDW